MRNVDFSREATIYRHKYKQQLYVFGYLFEHTALGETPSGSFLTTMTAGAVATQFCRSGKTFDLNHLEHVKSLSFSDAYKQLQSSVQKGT